MDLAMMSNTHSGFTLHLKWGFLECRQSEPQKQFCMRNAGRYHLTCAESQGCSKDVICVPLGDLESTTFLQEQTQMLLYFIPDAVKSSRLRNYNFVLIFSSF